MKYLLILLLLVFPLGQLDRLVPNSAEVVVHLNDLAVILVVLIGFLFNRKRLITNIKKDPLTKPIAIWTLVIALSLAVNAPNLGLRELAISSLYAFRWATYAGLYFLIKRVTDRNEKEMLNRLLTIAVAVVAFAGLLQYLFLPDVSFLSALNWDNHYFRLVSTFFDPGFTGAILVLGTIFLYLKQHTCRKDLTCSFGRKSSIFSTTRISGFPHPSP